MPITLYKNLDHSQPIKFPNLKTLELWLVRHMDNINTGADGLAFFEEQPDGEWLPVFNLVRIESDGAWEITFHETAATEVEQLTYDSTEECRDEFLRFVSEGLEID